MNTGDLLLATTNQFPFWFERLVQSAEIPPWIGSNSYYAINRFLSLGVLWVYFNRISAANNCYSSSMWQKIQIIAQIHISLHFSNHINFFFTNRFLNFINIVSFFVTKHFVGSILQNNLRPSSVPAVPQTFKPLALTVWHAAIPTPPLAPWTRTLSLACTWALRSRAQKSNKIWATNGSSLFKTHFSGSL